MVVIDVRVSMKLIKLKDFLVFLPYSRIEAGSNHAVYGIPGGFSTMMLVFEFSKFHVRYCVHHFKCFLNMKFMEISD